MCDTSELFETKTMLVHSVGATLHPNGRIIVQTYEGVEEENNNNKKKILACF